MNTEPTRIVMETKENKVYPTVFCQDVPTQIVVSILTSKVFRKSFITDTVITWDKNGETINCDKPVQFFNEIKAIMDTVVTTADELRKTKLRISIVVGNTSKQAILMPIVLTLNDTREIGIVSALKFADQKVFEGDKSLLDIYSSSVALRENYHFTPLVKNQSLELQNWEHFVRARNQQKHALVNEKKS